ncbi:MAG: ribose 5-phosphate isomerase B [Chloroflexi bacterium]|nr:ribose 5-phosphate isomerase B [Chloroflexota bacterium]
MKIGIGCDHAGFDLKEVIKRLLVEWGYRYEDFGTHDRQQCDYPDFTRAVAEAVAASNCDLGIFVCGTGVGPTMVANKVRGVRAALCGDTFSAHNSREHNDANMLCLGARVIGEGLAADIVKTWLNASFSGEERHRRRLAKMTQLDGTR